jgi:hypothetical protein
MSAISHTDWTVFCNHEGCPKSFGTHEMDGMDLTAATVRKHLRRWGWATGVKNPNGSSHRLDYCPDHKPQEG